MSPSAQTQKPNIVATQNKVNGESNGTSRKVTSLRDATQRSTTLYKTELGSSSGKFLSSCQSVETFFDYVAGVRLRQMPHHSSRWDKTLKWAEYFAAQVFGFYEELKHFADYSEQAAQIIWASCRSLIELGPKYIAVLEKAFGIFYSCGLTLSFFLRHHDLLHSSEELQLIMAASFTDLLRLVTGINIYYSRKQLNASFSASGFDELFGQTIDSFFSHGDHFTDTVWASRLEVLAKPGDVSVDLVRQFLTPHDRITRMLAVTRYIKKPRADFTCEWFDRHLADFTRSGKELLLVTGKQSTGKTVLSEFCVERLQSITGRRASEVLTYTIDPDLKTELTTLSVVKGLLLQMLQLSVGDNSFYKSLAAAYELSARDGSNPSIEESLWKALEGGLRNDQNQTIVIDGIDQLKGGEADSLRLLERLYSISSKHGKTKCIIFSQPINKVPQNYAHLSIGAEHTNQDMQYLSASLISSSSPFDILSEKDRATVTSKLVKTAAGNFTWLIQAFELLKTEKTSESILKRVDSLPKTLAELLELTIGLIDLKDRDTKSILAWLLAAERPLLIGEVRQLIEIDTSTSTRAPRSTRIEDDVLRACGPLIDIRDGFVRFRHFTIKKNLLDRASSVTDFKNQSDVFPFHLKEAHYDLTVRCLAYVKIHVARPTSPTAEPLNEYELDELFNSYELLQYAARYWSLHFQASPMHEPTVQHKITAGFKMCFPHSTLLAIVEGTCYKYQFTPRETMDLYLLTLSLRRMILGDSTEPVLQSLLNLARQQSILKPTEINEFYYEAWKLARILTLTSIATTCANRYIEITSKTAETKTEITTHRIELLQYIITIQRETKVVSQEIIVYMETLATLYIQIGETEKATDFYREIYELNVRIYGRTASQTIRSREILTSTVQKSTKTEDIQEVTKTSYEDAIRTLKVTDSKRISLTWSMVDFYERQKDWRRFEEVLVSFWLSLTSSSYSKDTTVQERKIDVALRYVEFLKQQKRTTEAEYILRGIWLDIEQQDNKSTSMIARSKTVGDQLQSVGAIEAARSVFAGLWAYYVKIGKQSSPEASSVSSSLTQTTKETSSETTYDVRTIREIFETTIVTTTTKTVDITTVKTARTLVETYYQHQEWSEIIRIGTITLSRLWPAFTSNDLNVALPSTYTTETIDLINRLGFAYFKLRQLEHAENAYRRIFYAVKATPNSSDELLLSTSKTLIDFYETHSMVYRAVLIYKDIYEEIQKRHGKTNTLSIKTLYTMGDISLQINDTKNAEFAYREIHSNLGPDVCHRDAIKAALALCTIYEQQRQYPSAQKIYSSLWQMFIKNGKDYELKPDFAEDLYQKYVRILKQDSKTDYTTLRNLAIDYRKALVRFHGVSHETTLKATIHLAELSEEKEEHREDAIAMYEEADQKSRNLPKGQVSETTLASIHTARKRLPHLYSISKLSTSPRAITLYSEEFQNHTRKGHAHRDSLTWLSLLVIAHIKQNKPESTTKGIQTVQHSTFEILKHEKSSQKLADSGSQIADIYLKAGLKSDAEKLLRELRSQVVFGTSEHSKSLNLSPGHKLDPRTWVFLVAFEVTLAGKKHIYSSAMADLIGEVFMYESYTRSVSRKAPFLTTLAYGSQLLQFTRDIHDDSGTARVEKEVIDYLATGLNAPKTINVTVLRDFFILVLVELHKPDVDVSVLGSGVNTISGFVDALKFQEAHDLAVLVNQFQQFQGGYNNLVKIKLGVKLALILAGRGKPKCQDEKLRVGMFELSTSITKQIMTTIRSSSTHQSPIIITELSIEELNKVSGLLGEQQNLDDLEYLLTTLWHSRHTQTTWSSSTVVSIGRLLVSTQFLSGNHDAAIHLCSDICYNLRRVWGALDATTLDLHLILSSFYTSSGNYRKAMLVHEDVLRDTVSDPGEEITREQASKIAVQHLELLKRAYQRLGHWDKEAQVYVDLYQQLAHVFGGEESWKNAKIQGIEKWEGKGGKDEVGVWKVPETFEFIESVGVGKKHWNYLRKGSGRWSFGGVGRLRRSYSAKEVAA